MTTVPNATNNTAGTGSTQTGTGTNLMDSVSKSFNDFMKLLTTQLKNQDPLNPMDTSEMTSQIAQLSTVQGIAQSNQTLQSLLAAFNTSQTNSVVNYIGKRVETTGNSSVMYQGIAQFSYDLGEGATNATITIKNANGVTVYSGSGPTETGRNVAVWDGINSTNGQQESDGVYTYTVTATDAAGKAVSSTTHSGGVVTAVNVQDGKQTLELGGGYKSVAITDVTKIEDNAFASLAGGSGS